MTTFNFNQWFHIFWETYPKDLLHATKGAKEGAWVKKLKTKACNEIEAEKVIGALRAQIRCKRKLRDKGEQKTSWHFPAVSVWVNQMRWSEEIPSISEGHKSSSTAKICTECKKRKEFEVKEGLCPNCWNGRYGDMTMLRKKFKEMNLAQKEEETKAQWISRVKTIGRELLKNTIKTQAVKKKE